jgi:hypothetical protein
MVPVPSARMIVLSSDENRCCLNPEYWRLGLLHARMPQIYIGPGERNLSPIYFEDDGEAVAVVMPLRTTDEELKQLLDEVR